ncbi:probable 39S ribosomal protein L23, mitochondrial [Daktulosphaira vitifoliae]|uniref:probable 39S ribosomal protein L23, mitochondrial n=1 Tax=Daktulosphaira vitifoliae TaxID=58002 RepID=UPI0021AA1D91|nr:probable 39S ribosomal protein L23, mitochondrial [Daktulosphaira vitifoliae]
MSTRWYPIYQQGNPQLRVFLPNFWMKLLKPQEKQPKNVVQFAVPTGMTNHDIKNYLEKIYKVTVIDVQSDIENGTIRRAIRQKYGPIVKDDDFRRAYVTLPRNQEFEFPEVCVSEESKKRHDDDENSSKMTRDMYKDYLKKNKDRPGFPGWFSF